MTFNGQRNSCFGVVMLGLASCAQQPSPPKTEVVAFSPPTVEPMSAEECNVWRRERSFAASVDRHDAPTFAEHVSADAVFVSDDPKPVRGRTAIVEEWASIIAGESYSLHWYPGSVHISGNSKAALSRGLYWIESAKPAPLKKYLIGHFISVWSLESDGAWRVLFDGGNTDHPVPATESDIQHLKASLSEECPKISLL